MARISYSVTTSDPTSSPLYDPRDGEGISFHADTGSDRMWVGLAKSGLVQWGRFDAISTGGGATITGTFTRDFPVVTTSNSAPDFFPQFVYTEGKIHIHLRYEESNYYMYIGDSENSWAGYQIVETI